VRRATAILATSALVVASFGAIAQPALLRDQLLGAWTLVSAESVRPDGSKGEPFGPNPKGIIIFSADGHFSLFQSRAEVPKLAGNDRTKAAAEEALAVLSATIAYYGTYSVDEAERDISVRLDGNTFANLLGPEQKRVITSLTKDELAFTNPRTPTGVTLYTTWRRAK
jgi:hypothetical protein